MTLIQTHINSVRLVFFIISLGLAIIGLLKGVSVIVYTKEDGITDLMRKWFVVNGVLWFVTMGFGMLGMMTAIIVSLFARSQLVRTCIDGLES